MDIDIDIDIDNDFRANRLWLKNTFAYLFEIAGEYYKVTNIIYWIEVLPFVGLKESIIGKYSTGSIAQLLRDLQTVQNVCKSHKSWAISPVLYLVWKCSN